MNTRSTATANLMFLMIQAGTESALTDMALTMGVEVIYKAGVYTTGNGQVSVGATAFYDVCKLIFSWHGLQSEWHNGLMAFVLRRMKGRVPDVYAAEKNEPPITRLYI